MKFTLQHTDGMLASAACAAFTKGRCSHTAQTLCITAVRQTAVLLLHPNTRNAGACQRNGWASAPSQQHRLHPTTLSWLDSLPPCILMLARPAGTHETVNQNAVQVAGCVHAMLDKSRLLLAGQMIKDALCNLASLPWSHLYSKEADSAVWPLLLVATAACLTKKSSPWSARLLCRCLCGACCSAAWHCIWCCGAGWIRLGVDQG